ncbi:MAG: CRISPR-associated endonuclease Cas3'' [Planctomycetes bacterium GWF2_41_51]|nr:MAG: CRISPR-associated endonuclease Cas3'' [Planctomycetes bacterium GWF2_41_51]HBG27725.1 CRISPR-associated endonuclease Cas3'' [Phycisphaerales bacterium]
MANNIYYAHSENNIGQKHRLAEHLNKTSYIASSFGINEAICYWFKIAGLLHDFGEYQPAFQTYLTEGGKRGSVPHAVWGAGYARILKMDEISFTIDGHHKGIPNKADLKIDTEEFKRKEIKDFDSIVKAFLQDNALSEHNLTTTALAYQNLQREFFIRWLFSALTDADWLNTESHFNLNLSHYRGPRSLPIDEMIDKLDEAISSKSKDGEINRLRNQVRENVLKKADNAHGFFSLNLPTGMGKTLISIAWALKHAKANNLKRIVIVLPYTNIIDQTAAILKEIFGEEWVLEHHSAYNEDMPANEANENELNVIQKQKELACEN